VNDWVERAACRGQPTWLWFPDERGRGTSPVALAICARCAVRVPCGEAGVGEIGIWGGMSARERRRRKKEGKA
jgi:hypothetical protein